MNRLTAHSDIGISLARLDDHDLAGLVASGRPLGTGIGGRTTLVEVAGRPVFVKRVPLTDMERHPFHVRSTANVHDVPLYCHYGFGSPGFSAWRELSVHTMTTDWVLSGKFTGFPLLHHWRVLPDTPQPLPAELADVERTVAYWGPGVRERVEELRTASASLTLFLEHVPYSLHDWFDAQLRTSQADRACSLVERGLRAVTDFLHARELLHFDAHFKNILTDGRQLYLTDYGLSLSARFQLAPHERDFFTRHRHYDRAYTASYLVNWLTVALYGYDPDDRRAFIEACAEGMRPRGIPRAAASILVRHARVASLMGDFNRRFQQVSRTTPYPTEELRLASA
ncbi:protein kinase family protein [Streptomyces justiciae]|uniref:Protein kinase family protein n=1 Tax=Streptomyces justiciae TaxID=2780140 RepID=A0ABU3M4Z8_9ACTN|nr:protein kinase family protein [Streptomyces justiciae]MDT7845887.1 protein kinase family protein [Streptomyces justiciae]